MCIDIGNMKLNTKLLSPEYMRIHIDLIPEEIQHEYNTKEFADIDGYVYMEVTGDAIYMVCHNLDILPTKILSKIKLYMVTTTQLREHLNYGNMKQGEQHSACS
jgi:hypothetical protein